MECADAPAAPPSEVACGDVLIGSHLEPSDDAVVGGKGQDLEVGESMVQRWRELLQQELHVQLTALSEELGRRLACLESCPQQLVDLSEAVAQLSLHEGKRFNSAAHTRAKRSRPNAPCPKRGGSSAIATTTAATAVAARGRRQSLLSAMPAQPDGFARVPGGRRPSVLAMAGPSPVEPPKAVPPLPGDARRASAESCASADAESESGSSFGSSPDTGAAPRIVLRTPSRRSKEAPTAAGSMPPEGGFGAEAAPEPRSSISMPWSHEKRGSRMLTPVPGRPSARRTSKTPSACSGRSSFFGPLQFFKSGDGVSSYTNSRVSRHSRVSARRSQISLGEDLETRSAAHLATIHHLMEIEHSVQCCIAKPASPPRLLWDVVVLLATLFVAVAGPLGMAYTGLDRLFRGSLRAILYIVDAVFVLDIVVNLRTAALDGHEQLVTDPARIAARYARGPLPLDLVAATPTLLVPAGAMLIPFCLKAARLVRLGTIFGRLQKHLSYFLWTPLKVAVAIALVCHVTACGWRLAQRADARDAEAPWAELYVADVYWVVMTMTTVGYGDIIPQGTASRLYAVAPILFSPVFTGMIVSFLTHFTKDVFANGIEERVAKVTRFMEKRRLASDIRQRVQRNLRYHLQKEQQRGCLEPELFGLLSPAMQRELSLALLSSTVLQFPLFKGAPHSFVAELAQAHLWVQCLPGDLVAEEGQLVQEVVFVLEGRLTCARGLAAQDAELDAFCQRVGARGSMTQDPACLGCVESEVESGAWFGERCLMSEGCVYDTTMVAIVQSELAALRSADYNRIICGYPQLLQKHEGIKAALQDGSICISLLAFEPPRLLNSTSFRESLFSVFSQERRSLF